jgi:DNA repair protein RadA/Sms
VAEHPAGANARAGVARRAQAPPVLTLVHDGQDRRIPTGFAGVDRVLGGGLVPGSVVLLAGAPGIGKSTLLLQLASMLVGAGFPCLIVSGEEAQAQVAARAGRLGLDGVRLPFVPGRVLADLLTVARAERPAVLIVDSIHAMRDVDAPALPGGVGQVRACADALVGMAKEEGVAVLLVGHVTKDGDLAGPRTLEHAVDVVLSFEGEPRSGRRVLTGGKNRFGIEGEVAWFDMTSAGLVEVDPGARLDAEDEEGSAVTLAMTGRRAVAVGIQSLVVRADSPGRRHVAGLDPRRFGIVAAVVDRAARLQLGASQLYGAAPGGLHLDDPGIDLGIAASLASAAIGTPPPPGTAFVGEVSLTGSVRPVGGMEPRLAAARAAGVRSVIVPAGAARADPPPGVQLVGVTHLRDALTWAIRPTRTGMEAAIG